MTKKMRVTFGLDQTDATQKSRAEYLSNLAGSNCQNFLRLLLIVGGCAERQKSAGRGGGDEN